MVYNRKSSDSNYFMNKMELLSYSPESTNNSLHIFCNSSMNLCLTMMDVNNFLQLVKYDRAQTEYAFPVIQLICHILFRTLGISGLFMNIIIVGLSIQVLRKQSKAIRKTWTLCFVLNLAITDILGWLVCAGLIRFR